MAVRHPEPCQGLLLVAGLWLLPVLVAVSDCLPGCVLLLVSRLLLLPGLGATAMPDPQPCQLLLLVLLVLLLLGLLAAVADPAPCHPLLLVAGLLLLLSLPGVVAVSDCLPGCDVLLVLRLLPLWGLVATAMVHPQPCRFWLAGLLLLLGKVAHL